VLVEHVLGSKAVRDRIDACCVGLAACCDPPEVEEKLLFYFSERFPDAPSLPFGVFMTPEFEFVHGFTGARTVEQFEQDLEIVENHPLFPASEKDAAQLAKLGEKAASLAESGKWKQVLDLGRKGAEIRGRCPERAALDAAVGRARAFAEERFLEIESAVRAGEVEDTSRLTSSLAAIERDFKGEPEADAARLGKKAVRVALAAAGDADPDAARSKALETYAGTRWEWLFRDRPPAPAPDEDDEFLDDPDDASGDR